MKKTVKEKDFPVGQKVSLKLEKNSTILTIQKVKDTFKLFYLTQGEKEFEIRTFVALRTGVEAFTLNPLYYIGTIQIDNGGIVLHIFEV